MGCFCLRHPKSKVQTPPHPSASTGSRLAVLTRKGGKRTLQSPKGIAAKMNPVTLFLLPGTLFLLPVTLFLLPEPSFQLPVPLFLLPVTLSLLPVTLFLLPVLFLSLCFCIHIFTNPCLLPPPPTDRALEPRPLGESRSRAE